MKGFGRILLIVGIIAAFASFNMDVSVPTGYGSRVNNIGLMSDKQNYILISCFMIFCGLMMVVFSGRKQQPHDTTNSTSVLYVRCPYCAEDIRPEAIKCKHCGSDLSSKKKDEKNITTVTPSEIVIKLKDNYMIDEDGVKKFVSFLSEKYNNNKELLCLSESDINKMMEAIPEEVHESFKRKVKHFIHELNK